MTVINPNEQAYLNMLSYIMENGINKGDRTGTGTKEVFSYHIRFDLSDGSFPVFTTKQVFWKTAFKEMLWMLSGSRNIRPLLEMNCTIWSEWPHKKYLAETGDQISVKEFEQKILFEKGFAELWGDTGGAYGYQWRNWPTYKNSGYTSPNDDKFYIEDEPIDQIQRVIDTLKKNPDDRRIRFTAWNVPELEKMMLPPCHAEYQFLTGNGKLNLAVTLRSWDTFLGAPFNIANGAMLLHLMALHTGFEPGELTIHAVSAHIYTNHFEQVKLQLTREPTKSPILHIRKAETFLDQTIDDFTLEGYEHQGKIEAPVAV
jgi:thymidylate synthase